MSTLPSIGTAGIPASKPPNQAWQRCPSCAAWWPVDMDFETLGASVLTECPLCGHESPFSPGVTTRRDRPE